MAVALLVLSTVGSVVGAAPLAAPSPPEDEPNDGRESATPITPGETITGGIPDEADEDWFAFEVEAGETINLTARLGPGSGLKFHVLGPDGGKVATTRGGDETISTGATATRSGTYYVRAFHWTGDGATDYSFTVRTYATTDREPNEDRANATPIPTGETVEDEISIGDTDWHAVDVEAGETINLTADVGPGAGLEFDIVDPAGETVGGARGSDGAIFGGTTAAQSGTYYVNVYRMGGGPRADYSFAVRTSTTTDREPNEDRANATRLSLNATVEDTISQGDEDWYAFDLREGDSITVTGTVGPGGGNQVWIVAPDGDNRNKSQLSDGSFAITATAQSTGTHYVHVARNAFPGSDYTLDVRTNGTGGIDAGTTDGAGGDSGGDDGSDAGGPPVLPIAAVLALVVVLVAVFLWRRSTEERDG